MDESEQVMRIGFDAKRLFNNRGGLASYARTLLLSIRQYHSNAVLYLYTTRIKTPFDLSDIIDDPDIIIRTYKGPFSWYWRSKGLVRQLVNDRIQIYHGLAGEIPVGIHKTEIKTIVTIHDALWKSHKEDYKIADRLILNKKLSYALQKSHHVICISESTFKSLSNLIELDQSKVSIVQQIAGPEFYTNQYNHQTIIDDYELPRKFVLAVGNNKRRKNIDFLVDAMQYLTTEHIDLVIVGYETNYTHKVIQISGLEYNEMPSIYSLASVCVYPSLNEGFGLPILESILSGTPVCVMDKPPMNKLKSDLLHLFSQEAGPKDLANLIDDILSSESQHTLHKHEQFTQAEEYAKKHIQLYQSI